MPAQADCVFCGRIKREEYDLTAVGTIVSFEPLNPVVPGHRLFVPRAHTESALQRTDLAGDAFEAAALYAKSASRPCNLITSAGPEATQTIQHLHVHYVPREVDDGLHLPWTGQERHAHT